MKRQHIAPKKLPTRPRKCHLTGVRGSQKAGGTQPNWLFLSIFIICFIDVMERCMCVVRLFIVINILKLLLKFLFTSN